MFANYVCWQSDWAQFNWSQQTDRQGVTWELRKPVPGQYACRNLLGKENTSSNGKLKYQGLMVTGFAYMQVVFILRICFALFSIYLIFSNGMIMTI